VPLAVAAGTEALQDANIDFAAMDMDAKREVGVVIGSGGGAQEFSEEQIRLWLTGHIKQVSLFSIPSGTMGTLSSEISMRFGFRGMSHVITTGCTSSTDAFGYSLRQIQAGVLPMILTGGVDAPIAPGIMKGFTLMKIMTSAWNEEPHRASRPFSKDRDGFVVAEGAWMFFLEEYEHAKARGAKIYAEVIGYGLSGDAYHITAPTPDGDGAFRCMSMAIKRAGIAPKDIDYINAHGTSTPLGDEIELGAVQRLVGDAGKRISMSSTKSCIGHLLGAAGAVEAIFSMLAIRDRIAPPTINLDNPSVETDLDLVPHKARQRDIDIALSNSFGFGGTNASLIFRRYAG
jgi:3-oxoacyl-[acyl-carrier-protein] synthase II